VSKIFFFFVFFKTFFFLPSFCLMGDAREKPRSNPAVGLRTRERRSPN